MGGEWTLQLRNEVSPLPYSPLDRYRDPFEIVMLNPDFQVQIRSRRTRIVQGRAEGSSLSSLYRNPLFPFQKIIPLKRNYRTLPCVKFTIFGACPYEDKCT